ncbi:hypothetical protein MMC07_003106 [Pseudocyphellaria aurata]|nr:hypothetical protein [Pseudocyphellaria aurata]
MRSATIVRVVSHTTLGAAPSGSITGQNQQQAAQRPPLMSRGSTRSILKSSLNSPAPEDGLRRDSRMSSVVSWTAPSLSQIGEDPVEVSSAAAGPASPPAQPQRVGGVQMEEDRIIGNSLVRVRTKLFRRMSYRNDEEEFEEIMLDGAGKQVIFVWGEGVDDIIA